MVCGIPADGAMSTTGYAYAIVCNECLAQLEQGHEVLRYAVYGDASNKQRRDINDLTKILDIKIYRMANNY
ncbi:MAG: hypothetical protein RMY36_030930 [Nostoc sp. SerVER01]|nr:hypothetical protein [Nostoc sp. SerVER01]